jgi:hypothetical protein
MRIHFQNSTRPKKAAKAVSGATGRSLSACQHAIAKACGYRDWHELEGSFSASANESFSSENYSSDPIEIEAKLVEAITRSLDTNAGDVQYALAVSRLTGNRPANMFETLEVRRKLFETIELTTVHRHKRGAIGKLKAPGRNGEHVILREYGRTTRIITHKSASTEVPYFQYVSPRRTPSLFIPMRLYVPYGVWTEADGAKVLFSRNYKPLWRLRDGHAPERVFPWLWIQYVEQSHFWRDANTPWSNPDTYKGEMARLEAFGIRALPILVEALPLIVHGDDIGDFNEAVPVLQAKYLQRSA